MKDKIKTMRNDIDKIISSGINSDKAKIIIARVAVWLTLIQGSSIS